MEYAKPQVLKELHCPMCCKSVGVKGERTETFSQYVAYCKDCKCEFTVNYFKAVIYAKLGGVKHE